MKRAPAFRQQLEHENTDWKAAAACKDADPDIFFPVAEGDVEAAREYCNGCPVQDECAEYGLGQDYGIWGGLSPSQRHRRRLRACPNGHPYREHGRVYTTKDGGYEVKCLECNRIRLRKKRQQEKEAKAS